MTDEYSVTPCVDQRSIQFLVGTRNHRKEQTHLTLQLLIHRTTRVRIQSDWGKVARSIDLWKLNWLL